MIFAVQLTFLSQANACLAPSHGSFAYLGKLSIHGLDGGSVMTLQDVLGDGNFSATG